MRPVNEKGRYNHKLAQESHGSNLSNFEFHKGDGENKSSQHRKIIGPRTKTTPSKWDDAQKWLAGLSGGGDHGHTKSKPRNSNADDRRLLPSASQRGRDSCSSVDVGLEDIVAFGLPSAQDEGETKKIDCNDWRISNPVEDLPLEIKSVCLRDVGTDMTPIASQEPSRTATPLRATTPVLVSPISSRSSTPRRNRQGTQPPESYQTGVNHLERTNEAVLFGRANGNGWSTRGDVDSGSRDIVKNNGDSNQIKNPTSLESRAMAWDEAERAKYMARYKREEVKIQAWENHEKRKAEMEMRRIEVKAEIQKTRAQERLTNKLTATRRIAEEKRANAEAKLNERAAKTSERADYIRRTGRLPFSFDFTIKLPSLCG